MHIDFLKSQTKETLTEFIEKTIYIYNFKHTQLKNITDDVSNDMYLVFQMYAYLSINMLKVCDIWLFKELYALHYGTNEVLIYNSKS